MQLKELDVYWKANEGETVLFTACKGTGDTLGAVKLILESGRIDASKIGEFLGARTVNGATALEIARANGKDDVCKYLEKF